ncbi:hypothetical protein LSH36_49g01012 [Paralvinella palmiformis]|uniref:SAP domain-containing protein n=1 Tax=Paralvinella palmiformis TaxID=53620 RepID=A0AAD9K7J5_9ANNE|nr:hypothetical protein LSH36_49g01012 [Paralvinella palmiformis]
MSKRKHSKYYGEITIPLLKQELRLRKAKLSGKKHQLIERLESYDRNDSFGHQLVQAEQFNMHVPEQSVYKDINSETQMPTVTEEQVKIYMDLYGQDLKENSKATYKAKFLRSIRLASQKENVYICGRVSKNASIMWTSRWIVSVLYNNASMNVLQTWALKHTLRIHQSARCTPANVYAIAIDHDCQDKSPEDMFLQSIHVTAITHDEQELIEIKTRGQRTAWLLSGSGGYLVFYMSYQVQSPSQHVPFCSKLHDLLKPFPQSFGFSF